MSAPASPDRGGAIGASVTDLAHDLAARMDQLAPALFPRGERVGAEWYVGNLEGHPGDSLKIVIAGPKAGLWQDFATDQKGDAIGLIRAAKRLEVGSACAWAREWLGQPQPAKPNGHAPPAPALRIPHPSDDTARPKVAALWEAAGKVPGTPGERYLRGRGITIETGPWIRYVDALPFWHQQAGKPVKLGTYPALLCALTRWPDKAPVAVLRIYLAPGGEGRARIADPDHPGTWLDSKKMLGRYQGCALRLSPLESGSALIVGEGPETMLSVLQLEGERSAVWAACGSANLAGLAVPAEAGALVIAGDGDKPGAKAAKTLSVRVRATRPGLAVAVAMPPDGHDWNDILHKETAMAGQTWAQARTSDAAAQATPKGALDNVVPLHAEALAKGVRALGFHRNQFFYYPLASSQMVMLSASQHNKLNLLALAPMDFWAGRYQTGNGRILWDSAANDLMSAARAAGVYDPSRWRGRGAWMDRGRTVYHLGDRMLVDGQACKISEIRSWWFYEQAIAIPPPDSRTMPAREASEVLRLAQGFRWSSPLAPFLLAGWTVIAPLCGALDWRPHIWVTGGSGTGKTTVVRRFLLPLLGRTALHAVGNSSESGIRQALGHDALPVLFDEAESNDMRASERIQATLELMRGSSSESGGKVLKGDAGGTHREYEIRSAFALVSINPGIRHSADVSRVSFLTMLAWPATTDEQRVKRVTAWEDLQRRLEVLTPEFSNRLFARVLRMAPVVRQSALVFGRQIALRLGDQRVGDQLGTLLAGAYALRHDEAITDDRAKQFLQTHGDALDEFVAPPSERDDLACLRHLLQHKLRVETTSAVRERSVAEAVVIAKGMYQDELIGPDEAHRALKRMGVALTKGDGVAIANGHTALDVVFRHTPWARYREQLTRLPFMLQRSEVVSFLDAGRGRGKYQSRSTILALDDLIDLI